jgi:hypothetical protein
MPEGLMRLSEGLVQVQNGPAARLDTSLCRYSKSARDEKILLQELAPGEHVCYLYTEPAEQIQTAVSFIVLGLQRGDRCVYVAGDRTPGQISEALSGVGVDVETERERGHLKILQKEDAYLRDGSFAPKHMMENLRQMARLSEPAESPVVRITGELGWATEPRVPLAELVEYELQADCFFLSRRPRIIGLCQYDARHLSPALALGIHLSHRLFLE